MTKLVSIGRSRSDDLATILNLTLGSVPGFGPILSTIIDEIIPDQRLDRIERLLKYFAAYIEKIGPDNFEQVVGSNENAAVIEDLFHNLNRAAADEKIARLANCAMRALSQPEIEKLRYRRLIYLIGQVDEEEYSLLKNIARRDIHVDHDSRAIGDDAELIILAKLTALSLVYQKFRTRNVQIFDPYASSDWITVIDINNNGSVRTDFGITNLGLQLLDVTSDPAAS